MSDLVFCLMGPTASGKTALACELVKHYPFEIISVDSAMIYRGMDIGTAKPSAKELAVAPHHLIDIRDPTESYSAAEFCQDALLLCDSIRGRGRIPLLVGGTMMYFNALQKGLSELPQANEALRQQIMEEASLRGWAVLHQKLEAVDPVTAARIHVNDAQRIQRALEIYYATGIPLSTLIAEQKSIPDYHFVNLILFPEPRSGLHERIEHRFDEMLALGFVEEVEGLRRDWNVGEHLPSMRCVGYRQILGHLLGEYDSVSMRERGIAATRQLAKRQLTWLRHWAGGWVYNSQNGTFGVEIMEKVKEILDNEF